MTRVFYCSTLFGAMTVAAAIDEGLFGHDGERRVLLISDNGLSPEAHPALDAAPAFAALRGRFDDVVSWNDLIAPQHPAEWLPRNAEVPMLSRYVLDHLGLDRPPAELVMESMAVSPARTMATLIGDCPITVYSDGLMSYGPTRNKIPLEIAQRIDRLLYLDLVPGLQPLLLREHDVPAHAVSADAFAAVIASLPSTGGTTGTTGSAMILGQYLSALGLVSAQEENDLHGRMLRALAARGHDEVVFKPHPAAGRAHTRALRAVADDLGVKLSIAPDADPAEVCFGQNRPDLVVGCFSTALMTAARFAGIATATMGAEFVLGRLAPYENSNRVPATIVDATVPRLRTDGTIDPARSTDVQQLVDAVGYCMQPTRNPGLKPAANEYLRTHGLSRYFSVSALQDAGLAPIPLQRQLKKQAALLAGATARAQYKAFARRNLWALGAQVEAGTAAARRRRRRS